MNFLRDLFVSAAGRWKLVASRTLEVSGLRLADPTDQTKVATFAMSTIGTGQTRTFTFPNATGTLALAADLDALAIGDLTDVNNAGAADGDTLLHNGTRYVARFAPTFTVGPFHINGTAGSATTELGLLYQTGASATGVVSGSKSGRLVMPAAGKVIGAFLNSSQARTAGTATLKVGKNGADTTFASGGCALGAGATRNASAQDPAGLAFSSGDDLSVFVVTSGWTPTNADMVAWLVVRFEA